MPSVPCPTKIDCLPCADEPIRNYSSEDADVDRYISRFAFLSPFPPIRQFPDFDDQGGGIFLQIGCLRWCWSTISQDDADDCARRQAVECAFSPLIPDFPIPDEFSPNRIALYYNQAVSGSYTCPDGNIFTYTVAANTIVALSQALANHLAAGLARERARQHRLCISNLDEPICVNSFYTKQITASGPNVAVFPNADFWELVSGTIPPGMTLESGFQIDGITFSGIPTALGTYTFRVRCTIRTLGSPGFGDFMEKVFTVNIVGIGNANPLPDAALGVPYSEQLIADGSSNHELDVFSITSGSLPDGLTLSTAGLISGTPTGGLAGYSFIVQAQFPVGSATALCSKEYMLTTVPSQVLLSYWKLDEAAAGDTRVDSEGNNDLGPILGGGLSVISGKINNGAGFDTNNRGLGTLVNSSDLIYKPSKGMTFFGWIKSTATDFTDFAGLFKLESVNAPINQWYFHFGVGLNNVNFNVSDGVSLEGISKTIVLGTWHFMRGWIDPIDNKFRFQLDLGAISTSATAFTNFESATLSFVDMRTKIFGTVFAKQLDEFGVYEGVLTDSDAAFIYNSGAGRSWPDLPYV